MMFLLRSEDGNLLASEISQRLGISKPTVSMLISKLESDGLITISQNRNDSRAKKLGLTEKAAALLNNVIPLYNKKILDITGALTTEDKVNILDLLSKIKFPDTEKKIEVFHAEL